MIQTQEMTRKQKIKMYMKCSKKEVIELLLNNQEMLRDSLKIKGLDDSGLISDYPNGTTVSTKNVPYNVHPDD